MAKVSGGDRLEGRLKDIADRLSSAKEVRVGFLENATYPDGKSVAMVAAINEFGAPARGIPPRPFFRTMIEQKKQQWGPGLARLLRDNGYDARRALDLAGTDIAGQLRQSIVDFEGAPLKPETIERKGFAKALIAIERKGFAKALIAIERKGFAKALIDTGHMLASVDSEVV